MVWEWTGLSVSGQWVPGMNIREYWKSFGQNKNF